jgi:type II secretory pathway component PulM
MSTRDRTILLVIALAAAIIAPWVLVVQPKRDQATKIESQISSEQSQLSSVRSKLASGNQARAAFASSYTSLVRLGEAVVKEVLTDRGQLLFQRGIQFGDYFRVSLHRNGL